MRGLPALGFGLGLRTPHYRDVLAGKADGAVGWWEVISENFMVAGGNPRRVLRAVRERHPVVMHGVSMSLGGTDPLDEAYLRELRALADEVEPAWLSDHLCWSGVDGKRGHDLWPLPCSREALDHVSTRVAHAQERLGRALLVENVSVYTRIGGDAELDEPAWIGELCARTGCGVLLDVNNVYVSARNGGFDAAAWLERLPAGVVGQIHLAGHRELGTHVLDSHDAPVSEAVWGLYRRAVERFGAVPTMIERDAEIPALDELVAELQRAAAIAGEVAAGEVARAA